MSQPLLQQCTDCCLRPCPAADYTIQETNPTGASHVTHPGIIIARTHRDLSSRFRQQQMQIAQVNRCPFHGEESADCTVSRKVQLVSCDNRGFPLEQCQQSNICQ